jgi:hypothetical protein
VSQKQVKDEVKLKRSSSQLYHERDKSRTVGSKLRAIVIGLGRVLKYVFGMRDG